MADWGAFLQGLSGGIGQGQQIAERARLGQYRDMLTAKAQQEMEVERALGEVKPYTISMPAVPGTPVDADYQVPTGEEVRRPLTQYQYFTRLSQVATEKGAVELGLKYWKEAESILNNKMTRLGTLAKVSPSMAMKFNNNDPDLLSVNGPIDTITDDGDPIINVPLPPDVAEATGKPYAKMKASIATKYRDKTKKLTANVTTDTKGNNVYAFDDGTASDLLAVKVETPKEATLTSNVTSDEAGNKVYAFSDGTPSQVRYVPKKEETDHKPTDFDKKMDLAKRAARKNLNREPNEEETAAQMKKMFGSTDIIADLIRSALTGSKDGNPVIKFDAQGRPVK